MTRRRRAAALLGLALLLGVLAASDVAGREAALRRQIGRPVPIVVVARPLAAGQRIARAALAVRRVPEHYAPRNALADPGAAVGQRVAVAIAPGTDLDPAVLGTPGEHDAPAEPTLRRGERAFDLVAVGATDAVQPGTRVDVLVTYDGARGAGPGATRIALEGAEILEAERAPDDDADAGLPRVRATLRVSIRQAVGLAAAVAAAREVRLLPRPAG